MKLSDLLSELSQEELERLAHEHAYADESLTRAQLIGIIDGVLRSHRFLQEFLLNRQPPAFAIVTLLLNAPEFALPTAGFRDAVLAETTRICSAVDSKEILARDEQLRVYRRVLYQARSNDLLVDRSEAAILGVLRQELEIAQVEHFLIEHHADLREFWRQDEAFMRELHALRSAGLVYVKDGMTLVAEDLVNVMRTVLGIDMSPTAARRLYSYLSNQDLYEALAAIHAPTSGSKEERIERLVAHMAQPRTILRIRAISLDELRAMSRTIGTNVSGSKDELVDRIVAQVAAGRDLRKEPDPPPLIQEPRELNEVAFASLFSRLKGYELAAMLATFDLKRWGTKEAQIQTLWEAHRSETTLLESLSNADLESLLRKLELRHQGTKIERIQRLINHFAQAPQIPPAAQEDSQAVTLAKDV
jgi:hypothetical protein